MLQHKETMARSILLWKSYDKWCYQNIWQKWATDCVNLQTKKTRCDMWAGKDKQKDLSVSVLSRVSLLTLSLADYMLGLHSDKQNNSDFHPLICCVLQIHNSVGKQNLNLIVMLIDQSILIIIQNKYKKTLPKVSLSFPCIGSWLIPQL